MARFKNRLGTRSVNAISLRRQSQPKGQAARMATAAQTVKSEALDMPGGKQYLM
jgi:hypothetical protein